ncbi:MAG TPA: hypothetical protein VN203_09185 [Candidatus Acidoferrum sp.]|nr:hypothetical protein [Candidatus Methylomirabilis sp.]HWU37817.1 hypothetical protein [Candidatus Acidoferrum sp.]
MKDVSRLRRRFLQDGLDRRLGNIASNLLRVSHWLQMGRDAETVVDLLRETASMIEWTGDDATEELVNVHRELCRWRRIWPLEAARGVLAFRARQMSERVLELSGLREGSSR